MTNKNYNNETAEQAIQLHSTYNSRHENKIQEKQTSIV